MSKNARGFWITRAREMPAKLTRVGAYITPREEAAQLRLWEAANGIDGDE